MIPGSRTNMQKLLEISFYSNVMVLRYAPMNVLRKIFNIDVLEKETSSQGHGVQYFRLTFSRTIIIPFRFIDFPRTSTYIRSLRS